MQDWASFFWTGTHVVPLFMIAANVDALPLAAVAYVVLMLAAILAGANDEESPIRRAAAQELSRRVRKRDD